jgi:hypothetical protein
MRFALRLLRIPKSDRLSGGAQRNPGSPAVPGLPSQSLSPYERRQTDVVLELAR